MLWSTALNSLVTSQHQPPAILDMVSNLRLSRSVEFPDDAAQADVEYKIAQLSPVSSKNPER